MDASRPVRIIGLGNSWRGDDAVGLLAARRLRDRVGGPVAVLEAEMIGVDLLDLLKDARMVIVIDAACSGAAPGTIHRLDASDSPIALRSESRSTHGMNPAETIELARVLGVLPPTVIVYGIEVDDTEVGHPLSPAVVRSVEEVVERVVQETEAAACMNFTS